MKTLPSAVVSPNLGSEVGHAPATISAALTDQEKQAQDDYNWCLRDPDIQKSFGGKVVVAFKHKIWGAGNSHAEAWAHACQDPSFPAKENIAIVVVPYCSTVPG